MSTEDDLARGPAVAGRPSVSFPHPLAASVLRNDGGETAAVALGMSGPYVAIVSRSGAIGWADNDRVTIKFPPSGEYRLLLGWADKGPDGAPAWTGWGGDPERMAARGHVGYEDQ